MAGDLAEVWPVVRDHRLSVHDYIEHCKFRSVAEPIRRINFGITDQEDRKVRWDVIIDHPGRHITSDEYLRQECAPHFDGGDLLHLLPLAATVPSVGTQHVTVALGTIVPGPNGNWVFAILPAEGEARDLVLVRYDFQWDRNCCFIKVKAFKEKRHIG